MHPRIKEIVEKLHKTIPEKKLQKSTLEFLKQLGTTQTEAIISIHFAFSLPISEVQDYIYKSNVFDSEDVNEVAYQTFKYM